MVFKITVPTPYRFELKKRHPGSNIHAVNQLIRLAVFDYMLTLTGGYE